MGVAHISQQELGAGGEQGDAHAERNPLQVLQRYNGRSELGEFLGLNNDVRFNRTSLPEPGFRGASGDRYQVMDRSVQTGK